MLTAAAYDMSFTSQQGDDMLDYETFPKSRAEAKALGITKYYSRRLCPKGHRGLRWTTSSGCCDCRSEYDKGQWAAGRRRPLEVQQKANDNWNRSSKGYEAKLRWKLKDPRRAWAVNAAGSAKERAALYDLPYTIDKDYILSIVTDHCPVFGTLLQYDAKRLGRITAYTPSLDRIVPELGYVPGNVVVMSLKANAIKSNASADEIQQVADWVRANTPPAGT